MPENHKWLAVLSCPFCAASSVAIFTVVDAIPPVNVIVFVFVGPPEGVTELFEDGFIRGQDNSFNGLLNWKGA